MEDPYCSCKLTRVGRWQLIDFDGSGCIEFEEFAQWWFRSTVNRSRKAAAAALGPLTGRDLTAVINRMLEQSQGEEDLQIITGES